MPLAGNAVPKHKGGMKDGQTSLRHTGRTPTHIWVVGLLLVLWNGWGVALAVAAQTARLPAVDAETTAYFDAQPLWFVLLADIGPIAGLAGAVAILLQSRWAAWLFLTQIVVLALSNTYEVAAGTSLLLSNPDSRAGIAMLVMLLFAQFLYARAMMRRGVLY